MRGKNSFTVTLRLPDDIMPELERRAKGKGLSLGLYLTDCIKRSVHTLNGEPVKPESHSVHSVYDPSKHNLTMRLPIYDPMIHKPGDKVRIFHYGHWKATIVPDSVTDNP